MEFLSAALNESRSGAIVTLVLFVAPGLLLVVLEALRGHRVELKGHAWAGAFVPLATALAASSWRVVLRPVGAASLHESALVVIGLALTAVLLVLTMAAASIATRRRAPLVAPPVKRG